MILAASLVANGVKPGDRVILTGKNRPEWAVAYYAIATAGAIIVPLDYTLHEDELKNLIDFSEPVAALVDKEKYDFALFASDKVCESAAVYTSNKVKGAPILVTRDHMAKTGGKMRAVIANSKNANTCNANGIEVAEKDVDGTCIDEVQQKVF